MEEIKAIVLDLDGTLLTSKKEISDYSMDVLARCRERGILVVIATARSAKEAARYIDRVAPDIVISDGGAVVSRGGEIIHLCAMPVELADSLTEAFLEEGVEVITLTTQSGYYHNAPDYVWTDDYAHAVYHDFRTSLREPVRKIAVEASDEEAMADLAARFPECVFTRFVGEDWYRVAHRDATKMNAIREMSARLGIAVQNIAAFGDDNIDIDMIAHCGAGVAKGNATEAVKQAADFVCGTNDEDGVARWLEAHVLAPGAVLGPLSE